MDDKMIIDFINNVQPDMSYGTSDGMTRAMVESAENMAVVNDYITESTYEVYTEAEEDKDNKQGFFSKVKTKIHTAFVLFVNLVKKAIEKVKGFFLSIKRKLTIAMAKALKAMAKSDIYIANTISGNNAAKKSDLLFPRVQIGNVSFNTYDIDDKKYNELIDIIKNDNNQSLEEIDGIKNDFDEKFVKPKPDTGSVLLKLVTHKLTFGASDRTILGDEIKKQFKDIDSVMNDFYNRIMKSYSDVLSMLQKEEKTAKDKFINNPKELSAALKRISKFIHTINYIKYKSGQLVASACLKMYKKSLSEARRMIKNPPEIKIHSIINEMPPR